MERVNCSVLPFAESPGLCDACGTQLKGKQRRWCSKRCNRAFLQNHRWTSARAAAKRRDGYRCRHCGSGREKHDINLEVNHMTPRAGGGYGWGCWHHLDLLETLCRSCHRKVTNAQATARKAAKTDAA